MSKAKPVAAIVGALTGAVVPTLLIGPLVLFSVYANLGGDIGAGLLRALPLVVIGLVVGAFAPAPRIGCLVHLCSFITFFVSLIVLVIFYSVSEHILFAQIANMLVSSCIGVQIYKLLISSEMLRALGS